MKILSAEEIGYIITRIAIADERFAKLLLLSAYKARNQVLPDDTAKIKLWLKIMENCRKHLV